MRERLVHLDVEAARQQALELGSIETGCSANDGHAGRVEVELILAHGLYDIGPAYAGLQIIDEARLPERIRNKLVGAKHLEVFGYDRM